MRAGEPHPRAGGSVVLALAIAFFLCAAPARTAESFLGDFSVTYYWVAVEDDAAGAARDQVLHDASGREVARVTAGFRRALDREGTGRLGDGRLLNVDCRRGGEWRYVVLAEGWGKGANGADLAPFHSVASDPARVPPGSRLHLPALEGLALPDGSRHDGVVVVDDTGSGIRGAHLDLFIALVDFLPLFERTVPSRATTPVFLADDCD